MERTIELVRIPYVLPMSDDQQQPLVDVESTLPSLMAAGILRDFGTRTLLVVPDEIRWYPAFGHAMHRITGFYPYLIQTAKRRARTAAPGGLRIIDIHGLLTGQ